MKTIEEIFDIPSGYILTDHKEIEFDNGEVGCMIYLQSTKKNIFCPHCGSRNVYLNQRRNRKINDLKLFNKKTILNIETRNFKCQECNKTFTESVPFAMPREKITKRLRNQLAKEALNNTFVKVADSYNIDEKTVRIAFNTWLDEQDKMHDQEIYAPRVLGIDEAHLCESPDSKDDGMRGVFTDIDNGTLLDITYGRRKEEIITWLKKLKNPEKLEIVTIDMWKAYRDAVYDVFNYRVKVVIDHFHVIQELNRKFTSIVNSITSNLSDGTLKNHKNYRLLLRSNFEDLSSDNQDNLAYLFKDVPELQKPYILKEAFRSIYKLTERQSAEEAFDNWIDSIPDESLYKPYVDFAATVNRFYKEIFNFFDCGRVTNAATEGINNIIKNINNTGFNYSFKILRAKMLYGVGDSLTHRVMKYTVKVPERIIGRDVIGYGVPEIVTYVDVEKTQKIYGVSIDVLKQMFSDEKDNS